ncbi:hypothetical protein [Adhaeribacter pallidiroseus]|uniref:Uncharacterized protein n=1 Tax=Adhaeribacter pallidiroseus TaxID=2072847 RepID=A0A369QQ40_9BACT|nr:hypothetical protein [Adhaeribacter pallidiroseus]RDC65357.1 hypothetical protein AHMF7616_03987 [Adhaeribacter pallidiroseus]
MTKLSSAFAPFLFIFFTVLVTACNNDSEAPTVLQLVSSTGQDYVSENRTVLGGTRVITGVYAQAPTENVSLTKFVVTFNHDSLDKQTPIVFLDSTLATDTKTFAMQVAYTPRNLANKEIWRFTITDSNSKTYQKEIRIKTTSTVNTAKSNYYTYTNVVLSRLKNPKKPFIDSTGLFGFASATGTSFPAYAVKQPGVATQIDLLFNDFRAQKPSLSTVNSNTLVNTTLTTGRFDSITNVTMLTNAYPVNAPTVIKLENLKTNQVLAFKSVSNKVGLLRIVKAHKTLDSLTINVKVEK